MENHKLVKSTLEVSAICQGYRGISFSYEPPKDKIDENAKFASKGFRSTLPRFKEDALKATQSVVDLLHNMAKNKMRHPFKLHWHGHLLKNLGLYPSQGPQNLISWKKTSNL